MYNLPTYTYPDGTASYREPDDGDICNVWKGGTLDATWKFDKKNNKWVDITSSPLNGYNISRSYGQQSPGYDPGFGVWLDPFEKTVDERNGCVCGSEKTRQPGHSHWCNKYVKP